MARPCAAVAGSAPVGASATGSGVGERILDQDVAVLLRHSNGSVAAVTYASGATPTVAGKPYRPMADLARARFGDLLDDAVFVGDRPDTDGRMAAELGVRFGLVHTGVTPEAGSVEPSPSIVAPDLATADRSAQRLAALPEVAQARTLSNLVPADQDRKLALIHEAAPTIRAALDQRQTKPAPTDQENQQALVSTATNLMQLSQMSQGMGGQAATRLAGALIELAKASPEMRRRVEAAVIEPLRTSLAGLKEMLLAAPVTVATVPPDLKRAWVNPEAAVNRRTST